MDHLRVAVAALVLAVLSACSTLTMRISQPELQADLAKRFPVEVDKHVVVIRMTDPRLEFPGARDVLALRMRLAADSPAGHLSGAVRVEGRIAYVEAEHAFYLREPNVTDLQIDRTDPASPARHVGTKLLERAARSAAEEVLRRHPIYRLDAARSAKEGKAMRHLRSVHTDGQDLVLEVGL